MAKQSVAPHADGTAAAAIWKSEVPRVKASITR
jgi:hypothetical protein